MKKDNGWSDGVLDLGDGRFKIKVYGYYDRSGKQNRRQITIPAANRTEAKEIRDKLLVEYRTSLRKPSGQNMKFAEFGEDFIENECAHNRQLSLDTLKNYRDKFNNYLNPYFGRMKLKEINAAEINTFLSWMRKPDRRTRRTTAEQKNGTALSDTTVVHAFSLLKNILNHAYRLEYIPSSPISRIRSPKMPEHKVPEMSVTLLSDILKGLAECESAHYALALVVAIASGCRRGEFLGINWSDIDWNKCTINIHKTRRHQEGGGVVIKQRPKNKSSNRKVKQSPTIMNLFAGYKTAQQQLYEDFGRKWSVSEPVFTSAIGTPMSPGSLSEWASAFLKKIGYPELSLKDLRHLSATLLASQNIPIQNVSARLGHARTSTTQNMYVHLFQGADEMTSAAMAETLDAAGLDPFAAALAKKFAPVENPVKKTK